MPAPNLPSPNTRRWVPSRKLAVVLAVRSGQLTLAEALQRYSLTAEEFCLWEGAIDNHGTPGLRTTRCQQYRNSRSPRRNPSP